MAPEIFEGKYSTGVDIYAFGMCVLEMATLETPYQECKGLPQIYKHIEQRIKPKSLESIECDSLRNFISKCLNDSKDRPSASELLDDEFFQPEEDDKKEVQLKQSHSIIPEVSSEQ
jgi:WNK lysine deficient protein kinase